MTAERRKRDTPRLPLAHLPRPFLWPISLARFSGPFLWPISLAHFSGPIALDLTGALSDLPLVAGARARIVPQAVVAGHTADKATYPDASGPVCAADPSNGSIARTPVQGGLLGYSLLRSGRGPMEATNGNGPVLAQSSAP